MSCNMRSKLTAIDHAYVHSYGRFLSFDMFLNPRPKYTDCIMLTI